MSNAIRFDDTVDSSSYAEFDFTDTLTIYLEIGVYIPALAFATIDAVDDGFPDVSEIVRNSSFVGNPLLGIRPSTNDSATWNDWAINQAPFLVGEAPTPDAVQVVKGFWDTGSGYANVAGTNHPYTTAHTTWQSNKIAVGLIGGQRPGVIYITYVKVGSTDGGSDLLDFDAATAPDLSAFSSTVGDVTLAALPSGGGDTTPPVLLAQRFGRNTIRLLYDEPLQTTPGPDPSEFTVTVNGMAAVVAAAAAVDNTVVMTMAEPLQHDDIVLVTYTG